MTHTPGPWRISNIAYAHVESMDGRGIASAGGWTSSHDGGKHIKENKANAKLIAAAPDLLAALQDLIHPDFEQSYRDGVTWAMSARIIAREAIKKATE